ncbi:MAG: hypothetical protein MJ252_28660 [archaeon]|nr:hypothetical protein [archaeon]
MAYIYLNYGSKDKFYSYMEKAKEIFKFLEDDKLVDEVEQNIKDVKNQEQEEMDDDA